MYLFLWENIWKKTEYRPAGNTEKGISLALKKIQSLMQDGITQVSEENTTVYLMDNLAWKGLYELEHAGLKDAGNPVKCAAATGTDRKAIWNDANQRWRIIENSDLYHQKEFYPDGVVLDFIR